MKLCFVNPSLRPGSATKYLPVGVAAVMTAVRRAGYEFDLLDIDIDDLDDAQVEEHFRRKAYDVVLAGSIVTHYKWMKWLTRTVKRFQPACRVVVGNSVGGSVPEVFLRNSAVDVVIIGEGEFSCIETLDAWRDGGDLAAVKGIAFLDGQGRFVQTPKRPACKIDELPMVDWSFFDVERYFQKSYAGADGLIFDENNLPRVMPVATARGCVFRCTFCHFVFWDDPYRYRSPENILAEIRRNIEKYQVNFINFWDDLSFASLRQAERMADAILASGLKFYWNAAVRTDLFGKDKFSYAERLAVARKLRESGCVNVGFSLESGNQAILDMMEKKVSADNFKEQTRVLNEAGISSSISVVFGYPIETADTIRETFEQCLDVGIYPSIGYLLPLPYTKMYEYARQHGHIVDENAYLDGITERQDFCLNMTSMPTEEIEGLIKHYAGELNRMLKLGLSEGRLLRTGGYMYQKSESAANPRKLLDPDNLKRQQNDVSLNYSQAVFKMEFVKPKREAAPQA
ncbi:MAG: B12-binding domain-containing radical SAM protein [Burkholderiales bacterium]